jgi:hypothetical protein
MFGWDRSAQHEAASIYLHRYLKDAWHRYILCSDVSLGRTYTRTVLTSTPLEPHRPPAVKLTSPPP